MEKLLLTPEDAAEVLSAGRSTVYELMRLRVLTSVKIGKARRVPASVLQESSKSSSTRADPAGAEAVAGVYLGPDRAMDARSEGSGTDDVCTGNKPDLRKR